MTAVQFSHNQYNFEWKLSIFISKVKLPVDLVSNGRTVHEIHAFRDVENFTQHHALGDKIYIKKMTTNKVCEGLRQNKLQLQGVSSW